MPPKHIQLFRKTGTKVNLITGGSADIWELAALPDDGIMSDWSKHFRNHYCLDQEIDDLRAGTNLTRAEYLEQYIFPDKSTAPGASIRSGDFAEILMADFIEYVLGYWVPRFRYDGKVSRNESTKGADVVGFEMLGDTPSSNDKLLVCEVKASLSNGTSTENRLQDAVDDSAKDILRKAFTLNAYKRRLLRDNDGRSETVERFQDPVNNPYQEKLSAAAILNRSHYDVSVLSTTNVSNHPHKENLIMFVMTGDDLMALAHSLYERAANEA